MNVLLPLIQKWALKLPSLLTLKALHSKTSSNCPTVVSVALPSIFANIQKWSDCCHWVSHLEKQHKIHCDRDKWCSWSSAIYKTVLARLKYGYLSQATFYSDHCPDSQGIRDEIGHHIQERDHILQQSPA